MSRRNNNRKFVKRKLLALFTLLTAFLANHYYPVIDLKTTAVDCSLVAGEAFILRNQKLIKSSQNATPTVSNGPTLPSPKVLKTAARPATATRRLKAPKDTNVITSRGSVRATQQDPPQRDAGEASGGLQIAITPRVSHIRVPVESNALLKCLISSQTNKFTKKFDIHWSRYMYDESVYEQIETYSPFDARESFASPAASDPGSVIENRRRKRQIIPDQPPMVPFDRQQQLRDFYARSRQETNQISELLIEATLSISPVKASDNASYYCTATDGVSEQSRARIDLVALSRPVVQLERVQPARDSKSALVYWLIHSDGNTPIKKTILMVRNDTSNVASAVYLEQSGSVVTDSDHNQWQRLDILGDGQESLAGEQVGAALPLAPSTGFQLDTDDSVVRADLGSGSGNPNEFSSPSDIYSQPANKNGWRLSSGGRWQRKRRQFNLTSLLPGVTYNLRLAAVNDMGQSNWTYLSTTMPNEIPAQISEMFLLSRSNDSLAIGWRRPSYDGAKTIRYEMQLFDLNRTLTLDANTNTTLTSSLQQRTNFMYVFVNLQPGTDYHFHVRACSRAGCSAFSGPKLVASTLDGESDEPMDVEIRCGGAESSNGSSATISWLPPVNPRGQLLNYSVTVESSARFLNASTGQWQVDEWRQTMDTPDNQTLSLDLNASLIQPNTNYTVRICANNRSKHCGRTSLPSSRAQCYIPPELPAEQPVGTIQSRKLTSPPASQLVNEESLILELAPISRRNGTLDCIQVVLIRLPASFTGSSTLDQFLPHEPSDVKLGSYMDLLNSASSTAQAQVDDERAVAYLAEDVDPLLLTGENQQPVVLGDGQSGGCPRLSGAVLRNPRAFDGQLKPDTFYTGFVRLVLVKNRAMAMDEQSARSARVQRVQARDLQDPQAAYRSSSYFTPVKSGQLVPEVPMPLTDASGDLLPSVAVQFADPWNISSQMSIKEITTRLGYGIRSSAGKLYRTTANFVSDNMKFDALGGFIMRSSPMMQLLEVGGIFFVLLLFILLVIYLISLPGSKHRKRKQKARRQAAATKNQQEAPQVMDENQQQLPLMTGTNYGSPVALGEQQRPGDEIQQAATMVGHQQQQILAMTRQNHLQALGYQQQVPATESPALSSLHHTSPMHLAQHQHHQHHHHHQSPQQLYGSTTLGRQSSRRLHQECPIHSSPMHQHQDLSDERSLSRRPSVHVCHPMPNKQAGFDATAYGHAHLASSAYHMDGDQMASQYANRELARQQEQQRNCRTIGRRTHLAGNEGAAQCWPNAGMASTNGAAEVKHTMTMTMGHHQSSVMALAKKINKSIPLRLFGLVFECRLRNGWLKEEYEQLPRRSLGDQNDPDQLPLLKLRPQLIVSRNDQVSALISGNESIDASSIRMALNTASAPEMSQKSANNERRYVCAKSPIDADSVWDFWRLVYEQEVATIVMLTQSEDPSTGEMRCAQYWPTCDNEETTILSPCNEHVQKSSILPAKFKIRQETLESESRESEFKVRRLTFMVMATQPGENEQNETEASKDAPSDGDKEGSPTEVMDADSKQHAPSEQQQQSEEQLIIVERTILHLQFLYWNTSTLANQMRLIKFVEMANERHLRHSQEQQQDSPSTVATDASFCGNGWTSPMLVHCTNGLGRSGLFTALSFVIEDLSLKLGVQQQQVEADQQLQPQKINLFQLVARLRSQREMLVSPCRLYELLYQLTANCIPPHQDHQQVQRSHPQHHHRNHHNAHQNQANNHHAH